MFDENTLANCHDVITGKENFFGLHSPGLSLDGFVTHKKLLDGYNKLHQAKLNNWKKSQPSF
jgi:ribosomal protein S12 methylthiotransferase accessory factor